MARRNTCPFIIAAFVLLLFHGAAAGDTSADYWGILTSALVSGGPDADDTLALLGTVDDKKALNLLEQILSGTDGPAIAAAARGLDPEQCRFYFNDLKQAALNPSIEPKPPLLAALARAGTPDAAKVLAAIGEQGSQPEAGAAFGLLSTMGSVAEPVLEAEAVTGRTALARETAANILRRMNAPGAVRAFTANLHDADKNVRIAGALGLAHLGMSDGEAILESASRSSSAYKIDSLVELAALGRAEALQRITKILNGPDESEKGRVVWAIARSGSARLKAFSYRMGLENKAEFQTMLADKLLQPSNPRDLSVLKRMLVHCDRISGMIAAQKLVAADFSRLAKDAIACGLESPHMQARRKAADLALQDRILWPILASKRGSHHAAVQIGALKAIRNLDEKQAFDEVEQAYIHNADRTASLTAAKVMISLDPKKARQAFERAITTQHGYVRIYGAAMLLSMNKK